MAHSKLKVIVLTSRCQLMVLSLAFGLLQDQHLLLGYGLYKLNQNLFQEESQLSCYKNNVGWAQKERYLEGARGKGQVTRKGKPIKIHHGNC